MNRLAVVCMMNGDHIDGDSVKLKPSDNEC